MRMSKIIKKIVSIKSSKTIKKNEQKIFKTRKYWKNLTRNEKNKINKLNLNVAKLMKNTYIKWEEVDISYFISDRYYQSLILPFLNKINFNNLNMLNNKSYFSDKNFQEKFATSFEFPKVIVRCINGSYYNKDFNYINLEQATNIVNTYDSLVFKKTFGEGHGKGVSLEKKKDFKDKLINYGEDFVVQELIKQHEFLAQFNKSSVNVIRITSLLWKGDVYILGGVLRVGAPGAFCDHLGFDTNNPRIIGLDDDGNLTGPAIDPELGITYDNIFGKQIKGKIPCYERIKENICKEHLKFLHHNIIGWDITIDDKENIICIEFNSAVPGIVQTQMVCGPVFSKKTNEGITLLDDIKKSIADRDIK